MITINTKASKRKKPDGTGWKCEASITYKQFTQEELQTLTPTEKKYITDAAVAYNEWEKLDRYIKFQQKTLLALLRDWGKKQVAYRKYLWKVQSPACDELSAQMCAIQYRDYLRHTEELPF